MRQRMATMWWSVVATLVVFTTSSIQAGWSTLDPPGSIGTEPHGIDGSRIVGEYGDASGFHKSFLYDGTTWTTLAFPGATYTFAFDVDGTNIVGYYMDPSGDHGFLYDGATWTTLDYPGAPTYLYGIGGGRIVGNASGVGGVMYSGGTWSTLGTGATIQGIDGSRIVASYWSHSLVYDGTTWTTIAFPGAVSTEAHGIDGSSIVGEYNLPGGGPDHGFLYDGTTWTTLDFPGASATIVFDIDQGSMVGRYFDAAGKTHGFLYRPDVVPAPGAVVLTGLGVSVMGWLRRRRAL